MKPLVIVGLAALSVLAAPAARADELVVLSAAAVRPALLQVPALFERATGHRVTLGFGNATAIQSKVAGGERVDIVILPPKQIDELMERGLLAAGGRSDLGVVRLGIAARSGGGMPTITTADAFKQALLATASFGMPDPADGSTSSLHVAKVLQQLGIADEMRPKIKLFADGTKALEEVAKGNIALTVAPVTSIFTVPGVALVGPLPEALQLKTVYAAALPKSSGSPEAAKALLDMLKTPEFAAILRDKGIDPP
jgi:molybdate transport system substrate-binding protein